MPITDRSFESLKQTLIAGVTLVLLALMQALSLHFSKEFPLFPVGILPCATVIICGAFALHRCTKDTIPPPNPIPLTIFWCLMTLGALTAGNESASEMRLPLFFAFILTLSALLLTRTSLFFALRGSATRARGLAGAAAFLVYLLMAFTVIPFVNIFVGLCLCGPFQGLV